MFFNLRILVCFYFIAKNIKTIKNRRYLLLTIKINKVYICIKKSLNLDKKNILLLQIILIIIVFILYGNTIGNKYSLDDNITTHFDKDIRGGVKSIPKILSSHYDTSGKLKYAYRPVVKISFAIEYSIFGENTYISHLINIILYGLSLIILFNTLILLFSTYKNKVLFSFLVVLIFTAHPIHTEVVASLKNRDALISFLFSIIGLYSILKFTNSNKIKYLVFSVLSLIIGFYSKPDIMVYAAIYPLSLLIFTNYPKKKIALIFIGFIILILLLRHIPKLYLPENYRPKSFFENPLYHHRNFLIRIQALLHTSVFYIKKIFFPHPLLFYYGYNMLPVYGFSVISILSGIFHLSIFSYAIIKIKKNKIISFGILFYIISISMFLNFFIPSVGIIAERFAFSAVLGFSIIFVFAILKLFKIDLNTQTNFKGVLKSKIYILLLPILFLYSYKTISRNSDWYDDLSLYKADIKYLNNSAKANDIYAKKLLFELNKKKNKYSNISEVKEIESHLLRAIEIDTSFRTPLKRLGYVYSILYNNPNKGIEYLKKYTAKVKDDSEAFSLMAISFENIKDYNNAIFYYYKSYENDTNYVPVLEKIANLNFNKGNIDSAIYLNKRIMELKPNSLKPYENIMKYYYVLKDTTNFNKYKNEYDRRNKGRN